MPDPDPDLLGHLDDALEHLLAARLRAGVGAPLPASVPTKALEAAAATDDNYVQARREAADAVVTLVAAVEHDRELVALALSAEAALQGLVAAGTDLGWRVAATARG